MTDKEILQALRCCAGTLDECAKCHFRGKAKCTREIKLVAADRLETLLAENEHLLRDATEMIWCDARYEVPVDEDKCVLALVSGRYKNIEFHCACEIATYSEEEGWILENWPEWVNPGVTHWMPLPEPPSTEAPTIADEIRAMSDEELVDFLWRLVTNDLESVIPFCKGKPECDELLDSAEITEEMCKQCLLQKLLQPYDSASL